MRETEPGPGQESVWDYPRPPRLEPCTRRLQIDFGGRRIVDTQRSYRVLETSHPPTYYIALEDIDAVVAMLPTDRRSICEWKGVAHYYHVMVDSFTAEYAAWGYEPVPAFAAIRDHVAFYAHLMDACYVDGKRVQAQLGGFYGGWITDDIVGPFKGPPGTLGW
jgi:uncharacterized protein (DUF427 family)